MQALDAIPRSYCVVCSPLYRSKPLGPPGQPDYINAVAELATELTAVELLAVLQAIENEHGRVHTVRWGPRTLDLDILLYGNLILADPHLTVPHPRLHERAFVLYPLYAIAPDLKLPDGGALEMLLRRCPSGDVERLEEGR